MEARHNGSWSGDNFTLGCRPFASPTPCVHAVNNPSCEYNNIDYLKFYYCHEDVDDFPPLLKLPVLMLWTAVLFASIAVVADVFFAPAVERISERLKLPEDVAGATLLALGGAAPDIFTQIAALVEESKPDLRLALSESIGAGLFVATFGKALTIIVGLRHAGGGSSAKVAATTAAAAAATGIAVEPFPYLRDVITYLTLICMGYVVASVDTVSTSLAGSFLCVYAMYVLAVVRGRRWLEPCLGGALGCMEVGSVSSIHLTVAA